MAVLAVVGFHFFPAQAPGGFVGVDVFFVISGFLITNLLVRAFEEGSFRLVDFYARRVRRLFPSLIVVLSSCIVAGWVLLLPDELRQLGKHVAAGIGFVSNIALYSEAGYFDRAAELKPLLHLWSLGVEEQFYLCWPAIALLAWRRRLPMVALLSILLCGSFAVNLSLVDVDHSAAFYLPFGRMWEPLAGCALAWVSCARARRGAFLPPSQVVDSTARRWAPHVASLVGIFLIFLAVFGLNKAGPFPGWAALLPVGGATLTIAAGRGGVLNRWVLSQPGITFIGVISYPWYLWHWPVLSMVHIVHPDALSNAQLAGMLLVTALLAWMTYRLVERPLRQSRKPEVPLALVGAALVLSCAGAAINLSDGTLGRPLRAAEPPPPAAEASLTRTDVKPAADGPTPEEIYAHQIAQFDWIGMGDNANAACLKKFKLDAGDNKCELSDATREPTVALVGDSHANAMYLGLEKYYSARGENLVNLGRGGCMGFWGVNTLLRGDESGRSCDEFMAPLLDYVLKSNSIHTVILANYGPAYVSDFVPQLLGNRRTLAEIFADGQQQTIRKMLARKKRVILAMDYPSLNFDARDCLKRPGMSTPIRPVCSEPQAEVDAGMSRYRALMHDTLAKFPAVGSLDVTSSFCDGVDCWAMKGDLLLYRDSEHLSHDGSLYFAPGVVIENQPP